MKDPILNLLGLITKAGKLVNGEERTVEAIRNKNAKVVFIAEDAGASTFKKVTDKAAYYEVYLIKKYNKRELRIATGRENSVIQDIKKKNNKKQMRKAKGRKNIVVLAVTDKYFANKYIELIEKGK